LIPFGEYVDFFDFEFLKIPNRGQLSSSACGQRTMRILSALFGLLCLACYPAYAQPEASHWFFGNGVHLNFTAAGPELQAPAALDASGLYQPSCISNSAGNPVLYTDGSAVYNSLGLIVLNGTFSPAATENLLVPDPGNTNRYYLFQSGETGLRYSIVDMTLNGGQGGINDNEKNISLNSQNCQLGCAGHATENSIWIVAGHNNNGLGDDVTLLTYSLTSSGVTLTDTFQQYYLYGGWFSTLDDMRVSYDCQKISLVFKGHYLVLARLNNTTGEVYDAFSTAMDLFNSFVALDMIEFSPNSEYLWSLGDNATLTRYALSNWTPDGVQSSSQLLTSLSGIDDIRIGPDGSLYLNRSLQNTIDRVLNPDAPISEVILESSFLPVPSGLTGKFPNIAWLSCMPPTLMASIQHEGECLDDNTSFSYFATYVPDSVLWDFGDPVSGADNFSTLAAPEHNYTAAGLFNVALLLWINGEADTLNQEVVIYETPQVDLGPDLALCAGNNAVLSTGLTGMTQVWNTGAQGPSITVSQSGIYLVVAGEASCVNSDTINVTVIPELLLFLIEPPAQCEPGPVQLNGVIGFADTFVWNTGETTPSITVTEAGTYSITASNSCFTDSISADVVYADLPEDILGGNRLACAGDTITISSLFNAGTYDWSTGTTGPFLEVTEGGTYSVILNYLGCLRSDEIEVEFVDYVPIDEISMPNVFTPNSDSRNTTFRPFLPTSPEQDLCELSVLDVDLSVYNRWGGMLTEEGDCEWRGTFDNEDLPEGTYYYIVSLKSVCRDQGGERRIDGHFTLLRD
jgi:gliding motility-associated-like protein